MAGWALPAWAAGRSIRRGAGAVIAIMLVVDLGAAVSGLGPSSSAAPTNVIAPFGAAPTDLATTTVGPTGTALPAASVDLETVAVATPASFERIPDDQLRVVGKVSAEDLASERDDPESAKAMFAQHGFVGGFVRSWQRPANGDRMTVRLYQFEDEQGAADYAADDVKAIRTTPATKTFAVPGAVNVVGIEGRTESDGNKQLIFLVGRRGRVVTVLAAAFAPPPETSLLATTVRTQLDQLPAV